MRMEINSTYSHYTGNYRGVTGRKDGDKSIEKSTPMKQEDPAGAGRKTANDELAYLSKKYDGYSFIGANYTPGMGYGAKATVNVAISPDFLKKMANDPELEEKYEKEIANMKACDERKVRNIEGQGGRIIAKGWAIDKDGNISTWSIGERGGNRHKVSSPNEYGERIRQQRAEKKKAEKQAAEKRETAAKRKADLEEKREASRQEKAEACAGKKCEGIKVEISADGKAQLRSPAANMLTVKDNQVTVSDSYRNGMKSISDKFWVEEGAVVRASMKAEKGRKFLSGYDKEFRDSMDFWIRMTQDPSFLSRDYSPDEVRERLVNAGVKTGFFTVTAGEHSATQFFTQGKNAAAVYSKAQYEQQYEYISNRFGKNYEPGTKLNFGGKEYVLGEDGKLDIPYGEDIYDFRGSTSNPAIANMDEAG